MQYHPEELFEYRNKEAVYWSGLLEKDYIKKNWKLIRTKVSISRENKIEQKKSQMRGHCREERQRGVMVLSLWTVR